MSTDFSITLRMKVFKRVIRLRQNVTGLSSACCIHIRKIKVIPGFLIFDC